MARARDYQMRAVVPNKIPFEKKILLKICDAELDVVTDELCPSPGMGDGSINLTKTVVRAKSGRRACRTVPSKYRRKQKTSNATSGKVCITFR